MLASSTNHRLFTLALLTLPLLATTAVRAQPAPTAPAPAASPATATPAQPTTAVDDGDEAGPYRAPAYITRAPTLPPEQQRGPVIRMRLQDALAMAIRQNLGLEVQRLAQRASDADERSKRGQFEPTLNADYSHERDDSPPENSLEGQTGDITHLTQNKWNAGVLQRLRTGTTLGLSFQNTWTNSTSPTAVAPDVYGSRLGLTIAQPLLRGFSLDTDIPSDEIVKANIRSRTELEKTRATASDTVQAAEKAYWDLVQKLKEYEAKAASVKLAQEQLDLTQRQIDAGLLPPSDRISAEGTLATRRFALVQAEADIDADNDALRKHLRLPDAQWNVPVAPVQGPEFTDLPLDVTALLARAARQRPELRQGALDAEEARRQRRKLENDHLPQLDVNGWYGVVGQDTTYRRALDNLGTGRGRGWSVSASFSWAPLGFEARATTEQQDLLVQSKELSLRGKATDIAMEVRAAFRAVVTAARKVRAAAKQRHLAEGSLDAEERKFMSGQSSNFVIAQRQQDVTDARTNEIGAVIDHEKALVDLWHATGDLLRMRHVQIDVGAAR